jgi:hypothetical protein
MMVPARRRAPATEDLTQHALKIVRRARKARVELRLLGSTGIIAICTEGKEFIRRNTDGPHDIDLAGLSHQRRQTSDWLHGQDMTTPLGGLVSPYMDREVFTARCGTRLTRVEVFFDILPFVHRIKFVEDFAVSKPYLCLETLLMSKLQMRRPAHSDIAHLAALLIQYGTKSRNGEDLDLRRPIAAAERDYRCWRDYLDSLDVLTDSIGQLEFTQDELVLMRVGEMSVRSAISRVRHGVRWWRGKILAGLKREPPEPEIPEFVGSE